MLRSATLALTCAALPNLLADLSPDRDPSRLRPGLLLYAAPGVEEPSFGEAVVLLVEHGPKGSMGLVINRPTDVRAGRALDAIEEARHCELALYWGGPVQPQAILALVRSPGSGSRARAVLQDVYMTTELSDVRAAFAGPDPARRLRVYSGYAGWAAGQLAAEVRSGVWVIDRGDAAAVFSADPTKLWPKVHQILNRLLAGAPSGVPASRRACRERAARPPA